MTFFINSSLSTSRLSPHPRMCSRSGYHCQSRDATYLCHFLRFTAHMLFSLHEALFVSCPHIKYLICDMTLLSFKVNFKPTKCVWSALQNQTLQPGEFSLSCFVVTRSQVGRQDSHSALWRASVVWLGRQLLNPPTEERWVRPTTLQLQFYITWWQERLLWGHIHQAKCGPSTVKLY